MAKNKVKIGAMIVLFIFVAATAVMYVFSGTLFGETSFFNRNISGNDFVNNVFHKVPALLKTIQIFTIAWFIIFIGNLMLGDLLSKTRRSATILKLINSFVKYLVAIVALLFVLSSWGVDTGTLLASAGILSLVIGLGAQSLIADIIAGIFIVFDGEFQVGDIVIVDGWRGTVDEIGIRATKIMDWQGNIKIVNNSEISTVINQSKELSVTTCVVSVSYKESIPRVEMVIKENIERIRKAIPEIVEGPYYKGVDSLGPSSVDLLFVATVKESDYFVVQRALNRELKILFDENNICIPFPQITINPEDKVDVSGEKDLSKKAARFAAEQREISKKMEDTNA